VRRTLRRTQRIRRTQGAHRKTETTKKIGRKERKKEQIN
jgi:hypothetical protein